MKAELRVASIFHPISSFLTLAFLASLAVQTFAQDNQQMLVYIGTISGKESPSEGIYVAKLDAASGKISQPTVAAKTKSCSFVALHPSGKFLYATHESEGMGAVAAFSINRETGELNELNEKSTGGKGTCFVGCDPSG